MFENFINNSNTTPNNTGLYPPAYSCGDNRLSTCCKKPYEEYDAKGNFVGYTWNYGDTVELQFTIEGQLTVESNAIIFTGIGDAPTETTVGNVYRKAYNTTDFKSWTCTAVTDTGYVWVEDETFESPETGKSVYVTVNDYLKGKYLRLEIFNFRFENEFTSDPIEAQPVINFTVDKELSEKLLKGNHYLSLTLYDENNLYIDTLINQRDCALIIK